MMYRKPEDILVIAAEGNREAGDYWLGKLSGELCRTGFPYDFKKTGIKPEIEIITFPLQGDFFPRLKKLSRESDYALNVIFITGLVLLLNRYTGSSDIIVGSPIYRQEIEGEFINTVLALRNRIVEDISFKDLLLQVRQTVTEAEKNQNYPIELLLNQLDISGSDAGGEFPLFDVMILLENIHDREYVRHIKTNMIFSFLRKEESIEGKVEFNALLYAPSTIEQIIVHFKHVLRQALSDPDARLADVDVLTEEEKQQLLYDFNDTAAAFPGDKTIQALFHEQVREAPDKIAIVGPAYSEQRRGNTVRMENIYLTYRQLNHDSECLSKFLTENGVNTDAIVGLLVERSLEMIIGILAILKAKGAYMPIDPGYPSVRQEYMLKDSNTSLLLTSRTLKETVDRLENIPAKIMLLEEGIRRGEQRYISETVPAEEPRFVERIFQNKGESDYHPHIGSSRNPAYIMYTSGSTGKAKGVLVEHRNVVRLVKNTNYIELNAETRILLTGAPVFDATTFEIWGALLNGGELVLVEDSVILNAGELGGTLLKNKIDTLWLTSPLFNQLLQQDNTIFSPLRYLLVGGDVLTPHFINEVRRKNKELTVINGYGPTENTTFSLTYSIEKEFREHIPIGKPIANSTAYILDKNNELQIMGVLGELAVGGDGVSRGYLNSPELTAEKFISALGQDILYKTGDLARWLPDGNIEYKGRIDYQVKVRGFRVEPEEIENCLLGHQDVKEAIVTVREKQGDKYLCAYVVGEVAHPFVLRQYLAEKVPEYMIPSFFTILKNMPLTPNGKIDRQALPEPEARAGGVYVAPRDEVEKRMARLWSEVLAIEEQKIGIDDNFFELGGHSLKATKLVYFIQQEFEISTDLKDVFANPEIRSLAQIIKSAEEQQYVAITAVEEREYYDLSYAQRRLWVLCQFEEESTAYNMPGAIEFSGFFDPAAFLKAIQTLANRHESLRTVFISVAGVPYQRVIKNMAINLEQVDLRQIEETEREEKARQIYLADANSPFDLERGPLFRFKLIRLEEKKNLLIYNFHHIINDGWSQGNIYNEVIALYNAYRAGKANPFAPLVLQYKDYTRWHNNLIASGSFSESRNFWLEKFRDKPNGIELPADHPRKPLQTFNGGRISFTIDSLKTEKLSRQSMNEDVTFFMSILGLVAIFLYKYSGQEDILIGAPIANRRQPELHPVVGFLVNTLVFRTRVDPDLSFRQFLERIKQETLECYEYQDYPFDLLVEQLGLDRDLSQSPLFNFMLAHNNAETEDSALVMEGLEDKPYTYQEDFNMSKFDLVMHMNEFADYLYPVIEYNSDLFERSTIERMADNFLVLIDNILAHEDDPISTLNIISESEYETIIHRFNDTICPFPRLTIRQMFENRVEKDAHKYAVSYHDEKITYNALNQKANRLAFYLINRFRVKPNDIIAISMDRSGDMIAVLLGVLKAGAAYLALDPTYPKDRVQHVLKNSRTDLLITDKNRPELFAGYGGTIVDINTCREAVSRESSVNPGILNRPSDILYVNYTSGSTGMPNGAMLSHDCLTNLIQWQNEKTTIDCSLRVLQFTSINFCVSFQEIMGTLTSGGELYLIGDIERQDIDYLLDYLSKYQIEILFLPFSYLNFLFNESARWDLSFKHNLKHIITAGEQLKVTSGLKRFLENNPGLQLHNHYGSTEMHVVTSYTLDAATAEQTPIPPAGKPVSNVKIFILNEHFKPVPIGVWGELFVAGRLEILGYINNDELNREKLVLHPQLSGNNRRLYRSGDSGRWLANGNIELRGRKDFLVKIRGFRVELGEIESKLLAIEQVRECVVVDREDASGQKYLVAYVVVEGMGVDELKRIISSSLPQYMIPKFVFLDNLPLMPNGKVDRERLPDPEGEGSLKSLTVEEISALLESKKEIEALLAGKKVFSNHTPLREAVACYAYLYRQLFSLEAIELSAIESGIFHQEKFFTTLTREADEGSAGEMNIIGLFEQQVKKTPDNIALAKVIIPAFWANGDHPATGHERFRVKTYRELQQQSDHLAQVIMARGAGPGVVVAILFDPAEDLIPCILAVLKAGAAYLLIPPGTSREQVSVLLKENRVALVLSDSRILENYSFTALQNLSSGQLPLKRTAERPPIADLDSIPLPDRSLVDYEKYSRYIGITMVKDCITILSSRGCPYNCAYCHKIWPKKQVCRSAENIFREVKLYYDMGVRRFAFIDDIFNLNVANSSRFFEMVSEQNPDAQFFFSGGLRGDILTPGFIDLMVKAGTVGIAVALETASPRLQKIIGKNLNVEKLRKNLDYICRTYPHVMLEMHTMHGFPSESETEAGQTLDFIKSLKWLDFPYIHMVRIYPNTKMEEIALAHGVSKEAVLNSEGLAYHEWSSTSPFEKSFTQNYQAGFLNDYFLSRERLLHVLPRQMKVLTEADMVQKYHSYLPVEIKSLDDILEFVGITREDLGIFRCQDDDTMQVGEFNVKLARQFPAVKPGKDALRIMLLDLSQYFSANGMLFDVVESPLGLISLLTYLNNHLKGKIKGKIAKARADFDNYDQLKAKIEEFKPDVIGIRTLTFYKDFFHRTVAAIRHWGIAAPIIAGGPYASSDYNTILQDANVDMVVYGEGEVTFLEVIASMIKNGGHLPEDDVLKDIPGLVYVPGRRAGRTFVKSGVREIVMTDQLFSAEFTQHAQCDTGEPQPESQPVQIFYQTSDSTKGKPGDRIELTQQDVLHLLSGLSGSQVPGACFLFDGSAQQVFPALCRGAGLILLPEHLRMKHIKLLEFYNTPAIKIRLLTDKSMVTGTLAEETVKKPQDEVEQRLVALWSEILKIDEERISVDANFFELGGHSLRATTLVSRIHKEFDVKVPLVEIFKFPTVSEISSFIRSLESETFTGIEIAEEKEYYELSYNQKRLWILHQLEPESPAFNMPSRLTIRNKVDTDVLKKTLLRLMERHCSLRTKFEKVDEEPCQFIIKQLEIPFREIDISVLNEEEKKEKVQSIFADTATSPFLLTEAPLFRTVLVKLAEEYYEFMFNLHHIITDGWSMEIIKNEFFLFYDSYLDGSDVEPEPLKLEYKDFCEWTNKQLENPAIKKSSHAFWERKLAGGIPLLDLPISSGGDRENLQGAAYMVMLDGELTAKLKKMAAANNTTLFVMMFSLYLLMLHHFSMQKDIACSIISAGRDHLSLHPIIGFFVNSLLFKTEVHDGESFGDFLRRMRTDILETFQNQGYPLELVCRDLKIKYPEISVSFNMLNIRENAGEHQETFAAYHIEQVQDVKFDLEPYVSELHNGISMYWVYKRKLFKPSHIEYMVNEYEKLSNFFTGNPGRNYEDYRKAEKKKKFKRR